MEIIVIAAVIVGFYMAWNIGANDVANSMADAVGSGALSVKQAESTPLHGSAYLSRFSMRSLYPLGVGVYALQGCLPEGCCSAA